MSFYDPSRLRRGNPDQQRAYHCLRGLRVFSALSAYSPTLCGTLPLRINIAGSDLDIICSFTDSHGFYETVCRLYSQQTAFRISRYTLRHVPTVCANFRTTDFPLEIFGQPRPVRQQHAFRHMVQEERILRLADADFREQVIKLKRSGMHTEGAFARLLALPGNPFDSLLQLEQWSDERIGRLLSERPR